MFSFSVVNKLMVVIIMRAVSSVLVLIIYYMCKQHHVWSGYMGEKLRMSAHI